ncbi:sugar transferase [Vibrio gigantis]|uniref:sugar transferase n=1 Tax=Vibrio gigantis TaxID=296199 RepID=UPI0035A58C33
MIRLLDFSLSLIGIILLLPIMLPVFIIAYLDTGSPIFVQERVGRYECPFFLYKFRTMSVSTKSVASHMVDSSSITRLGRILRKTKLDELPQLFNVFKGDMSLVGPRPNLPNQIELIELRKKHGVFQVRPGITGLAQLRKVDMSTPEKLALIDREMLRSLTVTSYFKYIASTVLGGGFGDAIK